MTITLERAIEITRKNPEFYFKEEKVKGDIFYIFNYRLVSLKDFKESGLDSLELRGLAIRKDGKVFWGLHKFFNDKENELTMSDWSNAQLEVREKADGSLIIPVQLSTGEVVFHTRGTFFSEQANYVNNNMLKEKSFSRDMLNNNLYPIFEFVSPFNQIVVQYNIPKLLLTQIRDKNGNYLEYEKMKEIAEQYSIETVHVYNYTYNKLKEKQKTVENFEGWVVRNPAEPFERQFRKMKTEWYFRLHKIISPNSLRENIIIEYILDNKIDDVLSSIRNTQSAQREFILEVRDLFMQYFNDIVQKSLNLFNIKNKMDKKSFALKYKKNPFFSFVAGAKSEEDVYKRVKHYMNMKYTKYSNAKELINSLRTIRENEMER